MAPDDTSAEERILLATVACIERQGLENLTIRTIAKEAGVNSAAINYYFRSKEKLLEIAMATTLDHLFEDLEEIAADNALSPSQRLAEILDYLIDGATRYPGITRAHFSRAINAGVSDPPFTTRMNAIIKKLKGVHVDTLAGDMGREADHGIDFRLIGAISAAMLPAVIPTFFRDFSGADFRDPRTRKAYVRTLVDSILPGT